MQKASGADTRDLTRSARLPASNSSASFNRLLSRSPLIPAGPRATRCASAPAALVAARAGCALTKTLRVLAGLLAGNARDHGCMVMQNGCMCVCHSRFQNEVIGGET